MQAGKLQNDLPSRRVVFWPKKTALVHTPLMRAFEAIETVDVSLGVCKTCTKAVLMNSKVL